MKFTESDTSKPFKINHYKMSRSMKEFLDLFGENNISNSKNMKYYKLISKSFPHFT